MIYKDATYRLIYFVDAKLWVGVAWNYKLGVFITGHEHETYTEARARLVGACARRGVNLKWFDGAYECRDSETVWPTEIPH